MTLIATLIANPSNPALTATIAQAAADALGASRTDWLAPGIACDIAVPVSMNLDDAEAVLAPLFANLQIDVAIHHAGQRRKRALIADMDSTMIDQECIDELATMAGMREPVSRITALSMNGELDFEDALRQRVALFAGMQASVVETVLRQCITLASGGRELVATMRAQGAWTALVSGGFTCFSGPVAAMLGFDEHRANCLEEAGGKLCGTVCEPILGRQAKADALLAIASQHGLAASDFIAVGDGANDLAMLALAGMGVALHAKPAVAAQARIKLNHGDLTALLYLQGYHQSQIVT